MLNGNDFDDYLRVLDPGFRLQFLGYSSQDHGGVHYNSAIWNNALWSIRVQPGQDRRRAGQRLPARAGLRPGRVRRADHPARPDRPASSTRAPRSSR